MLDKYWSTRFSDHPPIAHWLRDAYRHRWVRFHSLPSSKRYAESEAEWQTLLKRHNAIVSHLTDDNTPLELLTTSWSETSTPDDSPEEVRELSLSFSHWRTVPMHRLQGEPEPNFWHIYHSTITWNRGAIDSIFRLTADDRLSNVMILDPESSWLVHPYDGGVDTILGSEQDRDEISKRFTSWRSRRSDGL